MRITLLTRTPQPPEEIMPGLALLGHDVRVADAGPDLLVEHDPGDLVLLDARTDLSAGRQLCRLLASTGLAVPLIVVLPEGGLVAMSADWGCDDFALESTSPAELDARLRFAAGRRQATHPDEPQVVTQGDLTIEEDSYSARLKGRSLDLTYKEFELLKYLAQHPGRVFSRSQLLTEVWGYDYFGGTRTVDVHVRRLRAKLGNEYEGMIGTVRNVGYKLVSHAELRPAPPTSPGDDT